MDCYMKRYAPPTIILDRFNRSDGNLGNAEGGQAWLTGGSATTKWVVSSNVAKRASATTLVGDITYIDCGLKDITVSAYITLTTFSNGTCLVARMSGTSLDNSMSMFINGAGQVRIRKRIGGTDTFYGTGTFTYSFGTTYYCVFTCRGNDFTASMDGVVKASVTNDNTLKNNTQVGMFIPCSNATYDSFENFTVIG